MNQPVIRPLLRASALAALAVFGGCAVTPHAVTTSQVRERIAADQQSMYRDQEPVTRAISFDEAVARALKYNLDHRLKVMESALSTGLADVATYDMLPNLVASAGYTRRNNDSGGTSVNIETGAVSLAPSTSQERARRTAAAEFSWNVLDFGVSYYRARQQADQVLVAEERRRRVIQNILQDVRSAYWRAVGAQRLARDAAALSDRVRSALDRSREAEKQGLVPPRDALTYQRQLIDAVALLANRRQELAFARHELTALMNVPPGMAFTVVEADEPELRALPADVAALEEMALTNRPELREEDYRVRITADEARRQVLSLLPGLSLTGDAQHDSNRYLYNHNWIDAGARVSLNLFKLLSVPAVKDLQKAQANADEARRLALSMAVLTQVRVAVDRYRMSLQDLELTKESTLVDQRLASYARAGLSTHADSELELIRAETRALNSEYQRYAAYASAQTAFGRIYNSLGLDVVPEDIEGSDIAGLSQKIGAHLTRIETGTFPKVAALSQALPGMKLRIEAPTGDASADVSQVQAAVQAALTRNHIPSLPAEAAAPMLSMQLQMQPPRDGVRRAEWVLRLVKADGTQASQTRYRSSLPASATPRALAAFGEAATIANLRSIESWLREGASQ
jgi:outer membrane protein TolC